MKVVYANENELLPHIGCKAVADGHRKLFHDLGIEVFHTFHKNDLWSYKSLPNHEERLASIGERYSDLLSNVDAVIVNGEGTLHHGRGEDLLALLSAAQNAGKRTYLINSLIQEMENYESVLQRCDAIFTRDLFSFREASRYSDKVKLVADSFVNANFEKFDAHSAHEKIIVTDFLGTLADSVGSIVNRLLATLDSKASFLPFQCASSSANWRSVVAWMTTARCVVSARHHGIYAAAMAGRPFVVLGSNSHKMESFVKTYGDFIPMASNYEEAVLAIEEACDNKERFRELGEKFNALQLSRDYGELSRVSTARGFAELPPDRNWLRSYREDLVDLRNRRDVRLIPLRSTLREVAAEENSYSENRNIWDKYFRLCGSRSFLIDEIGSLLPVVNDRKLLSKFGQAASRSPAPEAQYGVTMAVLNAMRRNGGADQSTLMQHVQSCLKVGSQSEAALLLYEVRSRKGFHLKKYVNTLLQSLYISGSYSEIIFLDWLVGSDMFDERNRLKVAEAHYNLGRLNSAVALLGMEFSEPELAITAQHRLGRILIHQGDYDRGWPLMNKVVEREHFTAIRRQLQLPEWTELGDQDHLLLVWFHELGGIGGEIMWSRVLRAFAARFSVRLRLAVDSRLVAIFRASFPEFEIISRSAPVDEISDGAGAFIFARELPKFVIGKDQDFENLSKQQLFVENSAVLASSREVSFGLTKRKKIVISWKTTNVVSAGYRNAPLDNFSSVLSRFDFDYHVLQHGNIDEDLRILRASLGDRLHVGTLNPGDAIDVIARSLQAMNAVVTIDNTTLHIAGAFGVPTFGLISIPSYWQWPAEGEWSRWYDSVRLLRQKAPGDWAAPLERLDACLREISA